MRPCLERCPACPTRHNPALNKNVVPGHGPEDAEVMVILEGPGRQENNFRRPAVGKTGDELDNVYLPAAGLARPNVYVTNTFKCHWADTGDTPPDEVIRSCAEFHLKVELDRIRPRFVVLAGGIACSSLIGLNIDTVHGVARKGRIFDWRGKIFPVYHPALGIHMSDRMQMLLDDFRTLRRFLRGEIDITRDEHPNPKFYRLTNKSDVEIAIGGQWSDSNHLAIDTEAKKRWKGYTSTIRYIPYCVQFATGPDEAFMILREDGAAMDMFSRLAPKFGRIVMHNAPHDMVQCREMGIKLAWKQIRDTMSGAYCDGRLAKGLKSLCYRLLGMQMRDFDDVVTPYGFVKAMEYFEAAALHEWPAAVQEWTGEWKEKKCAECKGTTVLVVGRGKNKKMYDCGCDGGFEKVKVMTRRHGLEQKIGGIISSYVSKGTVDPWKRWNSWIQDSPEQMEFLLNKLGPVPLPSIEMVPEAEAMTYACGDAVGTWRIYPIVEQRLIDIRRAGK